MSYDNYKYKYENIQTQKQKRDQTQTSPLSKYKCEYKYKHKVGTLHQVAYYENPGILMIVQSVEDQEGTKANQGDSWTQDQTKSILIDSEQKQIKMIDKININQNQFWSIGRKKIKVIDIKRQRITLYKL